jgi:hypothetical protein
MERVYSVNVYAIIIDVFISLDNNSIIKYH